MCPEGKTKNKCKASALITLQKYFILQQACFILSTMINLLMNDFSQFITSLQVMFQKTDLDAYSGKSELKKSF